MKLFDVAEQVKRLSPAEQLALVEFVADALEKKFSGSVRKKDFEKGNTKAKITFKISKVAVGVS